jgi:predicted site-specific integrase-resolvase
MQIVYTSGRMAQVLGVSRRTMHRAINTGRIEKPSVLVVGPTGSRAAWGFTEAQMRRIKKRGLQLHERV